jgi:hypothetical protein
MSITHNQIAVGTSSGLVDTQASAYVTALLDAMVGDSGSGGTKGLVPAPVTGDATKFLRGDGTWADAGGGTPFDPNADNNFTVDQTMTGIKGVAATAGSDPGNDLNVRGGAGHGSGAGGWLNLYGGYDGGGGGKGGSIFLSGAGSQSADGDGGDVVIDGGSSAGGGVGGVITIGTGNAESVTIGRSGKTTYIDGVLTGRSSPFAINNGDSPTSGLQFYNDEIHVFGRMADVSGYAPRFAVANGLYNLTANGEMTFELNQAANQLIVHVQYSNGATKSATIALT